ncbi:replicative DNA helicase [Helicobacter cetorum]|uniref:Replicative DNA helicase n=1 Tax=Helicobacter cetorum (strain ATCC BAA-540 / CCUG 52418 / MIT 99-5656) TaxID=1163745 RepID=I0ESD1_HELCM|nr:replicative DNA helicase [Helicobacter cetorum]AFI05850.1 replicative DNA helicase [Helicobacter cetorum MIT 99-5656]
MELEQLQRLQNIERIVLSGIVFANDKIQEVHSILEPSDFYYPPNGLFFEIALKLYEESYPIDENFIRQKMPSDKQISEEDLLAIFAASPMDNIEAYVEEIKNASIKRKLFSLANTIREKSLESPQKSSDILNSVEQEVYALLNGSTIDGFRDIKEVLSSTMKMITENMEKGSLEVTGVPTGFTQLDSYTTGFNKGNLVIIGGRPAMGKTSLMMNMVLAALNDDKGVAVFSLEMSAEALVLRALSDLTSINMHDLESGRLDDREWEILAKRFDELSLKQLFFYDKSYVRIEQIRLQLRKLKAQHKGLEIAFIDYLQLMSGSKNTKERHEQIAEISRELKTLARELEIPIVALVQLNRALEGRDDKRPILSDIKDSGGIEQDADIVLFLYRDYWYRIQAENNKIDKLKREGKVEEAETLRLKVDEERRLHKQNGSVEDAEIIVAKNRNGATGTVYTRYNAPLTRYEDISVDTTHLEEQETKLNIMPI